ncbi:MAG: diacylglycerol kinase [Flavobacteriales bacterium]
MKSPKQLIAAIGHSITGVLTAFKDETSIKIQFILGMVTVFFGFYFNISKTEWFAVILCIAGVLGMEIMNSAIENLSDRITTEKDPFIKKAKDMGAGAVMMMALASIIVACIIFIPKFIA